MSTTFALFCSHLWLGCAIQAHAFLENKDSFKLDADEAEEESTFNSDAYDGTSQRCDGLTDFEPENEIHKTAHIVKDWAAMVEGKQGNTDERGNSREHKKY
jgi:hypothetical protein